MILCFAIFFFVQSIFVSVFRFSHLKTVVFRFGVLCGLQVFSDLVFGFRFFFSTNGGFSDFSVQSGNHRLMDSWSNAFYRQFFWFCQGSFTPQSR